MLLGPGRGSLCVDDVGRRRGPLAIPPANDPQRLGRLLDGGASQPDSLLVCHDAAVGQVHLEADGVQDVLGVRERGLDLSVGLPQLSAVLAAGVQRSVDVQPCPLLPAGNHVFAIGMAHGCADEDARQEFAFGRFPALLGGHHRLPRHRDLRPLSCGEIQRAQRAHRATAAATPCPPPPAASWRCAPWHCSGGRRHRTRLRGPRRGPRGSRKVGLPLAARRP